jgi:hypothetical protein
MAAGWPVQVEALEPRVRGVLRCPEVSKLALFTPIPKQEEREISRISRPGGTAGREDPPIPFLRGNALAYFRFCDQ